MSAVVPPGVLLSENPALGETLARMRDGRQMMYMARPGGVQGLPLEDLCVMMDCEWLGMGASPFAFAILVGNYRTREIYGLVFVTIPHGPRTARDLTAGDEGTLAWWQHEDRRELFQELTKASAGVDVELRLEVVREFCRAMRLPEHEVAAAGDCDRDFWSLHQLLGVGERDEQFLGKGTYHIENYGYGHKVMQRTNPAMAARVDEKWKAIANPLKHHPLYDVVTEFANFCAYRQVLDGEKGGA